MKSVLIWVGKKRRGWASTGCTEYIRRLPRALPFEEVRVQPERFQGDEERVRRAEGERILGHLRTGDRLVTLDERGEVLTTDAFAGIIRSASQSGVRRVVWAIGGPYGHDVRVRKAAWKVAALSGMVLNHELARLVVSEQLYRASTLIWGGAYHH